MPIDALPTALARLPTSFLAAHSPTIAIAASQDAKLTQTIGSAADNADLREGSYAIGPNGKLYQVTEGSPVEVLVKSKTNPGGIFQKHANIVRALIPIRDCVRKILLLQSQGEDSGSAQQALRRCYYSFVRAWGPINKTVVSVHIDDETGDTRSTHRHPNLSPFADDPDIWLVASIEEYDLESGTAKQGAIFHSRVMATPKAPIIETPSDALAVTLAERGFVDIQFAADLLGQSTETLIAELNTAIYLNPETGIWETKDQYLSGYVREKLAIAEIQAVLEPRFQRNIDALKTVQPRDLTASDIAVRLGVPWIPAEYINEFAKQVLGGNPDIRHFAPLAIWSMNPHALSTGHDATVEWGTGARPAGRLLDDALNSRIPEIFDIIPTETGEKRVLNVKETEAAKEKLGKIQDEFAHWIWLDATRADRLVKRYNNDFNNLVPRFYDGSHLDLPGTNPFLTLRPHQKRFVWRVITAGSTYAYHCVGAGKSMALAAAIMEQRRLGLIGKAMMVVPGHTLAQIAREFLTLYPLAQLLVADETNFQKSKRSQFLARAATGNWDAILISHSAFRFITIPARLEKQAIDDEVDTLAQWERSYNLTTYRG